MPRMDDVTEHNPLLQQAMDNEAYNLLVEQVGDELAAAQPDHHIRTVEDADWVLTMMANWNAEKERVLKAANERAARLDKLVDFFKRKYSQELEDFARAQLEGKKTKTLNMPCGAKLYFRHVKPSLAVDPNAKDRLISWVKQYLPGEYIRVTEDVNKSLLNEYVDATGDIPPGCTMTEAQDRFYFGL